ncbi:hypothetical protein HPB50_002804 [Hyalomma asiaticum]|uniref:Uncharacterized protein n=1 Tax=Hyalomma asiaticum TaxID=266040 RepID=A0ACB7S3U9_HYAAI|nr:hypothetical protein HPB50_002804 [Hyalomma asiaticum]
MKGPVTLIALTAVLGTCGCFQTECNTLSWNVSKEDHPALPPERLEELLRCPEQLHGCNASHVNCWGFSGVTCSCAANCERYGDCCWDAGGSLSSPTTSKCIQKYVKELSVTDFYVVSGCDPKWPDDEVRGSCENADKFQETFYGIPVTTEREVTYFNAYCALCNYDLDNTSMFWNVSEKDENASFPFFAPPLYAPPPYALEKRDIFFRTCDASVIGIQTCPGGTDPETKRKCLTYFAPVKYETNGTDVVYKNVYCGLCNDAELSTMKCLPKPVAPDIYGHVAKVSPFLPNLVSIIIRPVVRLDTCFSWHKGKCHIKTPLYRYTNVSTQMAANETAGILASVTSSGHESNNVKSYLTVICLSLSLVCLFLKGVVYLSYKSSRIFFIEDARFRFRQRYSAAICFFSWETASMCPNQSAVLSFDIWKNVAADRLTSSSHRRFLLYALIAWGGPLIVIAVCLVLNWTAPDFVFSPQYGRFACWIGSIWGQLAFFLMPMGTLLVLDIGLYVHIVVHIRSTAKQVTAFDFKGGGNKSHMALFVKLAFIMGTTWLLAFVGAFVSVFALDVLVIVFIGLQGVYLFFGFKDYEYLLRRRSRRKRTAVATGVSTARTELPSSGKDSNSREDIRPSSAALHGCSASRISCSGFYALTCSCAANCELYGDCCWDAGGSLSSPAASTCIGRKVDNYLFREFYVVSACNPRWPLDEARNSCENATNLEDPFYRIPVTTKRPATYLNAFCALCNYDLDNKSVFWNASGSAGGDFQVAPPQYVLENGDVFFWPCDANLVDVDTCPEGTDPETKRKCLTYFAPVQYKTNETELVYKNVYCGLCNDAELSAMKCVQKQAVSEFQFQEELVSSARPNLLTLIRPVVSNDTCFSWHNGRCYIRTPQYRYADVSTPMAENETTANMTNGTNNGHEPYNVLNYLTVICISLSLACLFLKALIYVVYRTSRTFSSRQHMEPARLLSRTYGDLLVLDIGLYAHIVAHIRSTTRQVTAFDFKSGNSKSHMALFVKLAFIMGTTWLLGFVGAFVNVLVLDIIVTILLGLQGVYLFFGFKDYEYLLPRLTRRKQRAVVATGVATAHTELSSSGIAFNS